MYSWEEEASGNMQQDCVLGLPLCNTRVNGLEGRVKSSLIILTGLLNWEVPLTPGGKRKICRGI